MLRFDPSPRYRRRRGVALVLGTVVLGVAIAIGLLAFNVFTALLIGLIG
jgi:hypothetical protein